MTVDPLTEAARLAEKLADYAEFISHIAIDEEDLATLRASASALAGLVERVQTAEAAVAAFSDSERVAKLFHGVYEDFAPRYGYETRPESAVRWEDVPEPNKSLMVAVAAEVCGYLLNIKYPAAVPVSGDTDNQPAAQFDENERDAT